MLVGHWDAYGATWAPLFHCWGRGDAHAHLFEISIIIEGDIRCRTVPRPTIRVQATGTRVHPAVALALVQASSLICVDKALSRPHGLSGLPSPLLRQKSFPPAWSCPAPPPPSTPPCPFSSTSSKPALDAAHTMFEGEDPSSFATAPAVCRLQSMSIALGLVAPWVR